MITQWLNIWLTVCIAILVCAGSIHGHVRVKRKPGDRPAPGKCISFNRGGSSRVHFYACCNNINGTDTSCDGQTYQRGSSTSYCNSGGADKGNGVVKAEFACGGCVGQGNVANICKPSFKLLDIPGTCWMFTICFKKHCKKRYSDQRSGLNLQVVDPSISSMPDTCYNYVCDPGETTDNCPADCCFKQNPSQCTWVANGTCIPEFCDTPSCALNGGVGVSPTLGTSNIGVLVLGLAIMFLYVYEHE